MQNSGAAMATELAETLTTGTDRDGEEEKPEEKLTQELMVVSVKVGEA
jgi:hypothetical protein